MKPMQIVVLLVMVIAIIFGVTFASMYVSRAPAPPSARKNKGKVTPANADLHLSFPLVEYPPESSEPARRIATEYGQSGQHDFWFENPNDEEVRVGLLAVNCTSCSEVRLFIVPESWHSSLASVAASWPGQGAGGELPSILTALAFLQKREGLQMQATRGRLLEKGAAEGVSVPPRAVGFIRLQWEARRAPAPGPRLQKLSADLWWQDPHSGGGVTLKANAFFVDGLRMDIGDISAGTLLPGDSAERTVRVWSSTRYNLEEPEIVSTGAPFVTCARPAPLTEHDRQALSTFPDGGLIGGEVRSGYQLRVTAKERLADGTRFDEGYFQHQILIKPRERIILPEPLEVQVRGAVRGDVSLVGAENGIVLEPFAVRNGTQRRISLHTARKDLSLKLEQVPKFMKVHLGEPKTDAGGRTWSLALEIGPNQVSGTFPRRDSEAYRDTAIYLRIEGAANRRLRIPVTGKATQ